MKKIHSKKNSYKKYLIIAIVAILFAIVIYNLNHIIHEDMPKDYYVVGEKQSFNETLSYSILNIEIREALEADHIDNHVPNHRTDMEGGKWVIIDYEIQNIGLEDRILSKTTFRLRDENISYYNVSAEIYHLLNYINKTTMLKPNENYQGGTLFEVPNSTNKYVLEILNKDYEGQIIKFQIEASESEGKHSIHHHE